MKIGEKLKEKRSQAGISQETIAKHLGVTRQTVSSWENDRSYPDIGSILKLSDLYGLSLDELLKEDPIMRKHMEDNSVLPRKYWNMLFEIAILLLPFGSLAVYWGAPWVGLTLQLIGVVMLPPLWVARWKLFGMPKEAMNESLIGWSVYLVGSLLRLASSGFIIGGTTIAIAGLLMIYANGVYLERGTRFWLVIALYIGIPLYILGSSFISQLDELGAFSDAQPFGSDYRIVEVEYGAEPEDHPAINLDQSNRLRFDGKLVGKFYYTEPRPEQTDKGIWQLIPNEQTNTMYKLEVSAEDETTLAYFADDQLQWRWEIGKIPKIHFILRTEGFDSASQMDWFPKDKDSVDPIEINYSYLTGTGSASLQCSDDNVMQFTVIEEYHWNDQVEIREYLLKKDKTGEFHLPEQPVKRYEGDGQYALYAIKWENGMFLFRLNFQ